MTPTSSTDSERRYSLAGLDCAGCARTIEKGIGRLEGVRSCEVDFPSSRMRIEGSPSDEAVLEQVRRLGFEAYPAVGNGADPSEGRAAGSAPEPPSSIVSYMLSRREAWPALIGGLLLLPGLIFHEVLQFDAAWIELPALVAVVLAGTPIARGAWRGFRVSHELNIQALMTIAVLGALLIGAWVEAGMVVVLFSIGEALEGYAANRARGAIRSLMTTAPEEALLIRAGSHSADPDATTQPLPEGRRVPVESLRPEDVILVHPGERIPMDGRVVEGRSSVDQAALTGESLPIDRAPGDEVMAGSVNGEGVLTVEVTHLASETTLHRMIRMVEEAQSRRAPVQRFIDRFARVYTPAVVALALAVAVVPPLAFGAPFWNPNPETFGWFYRALALLVVACPCALVISVPASVVSAITNAARSGILVKGGEHMEALAKVTTVAFDKTGTLTEGALTVVAVRSVDCPAPDGDPEAACEPCDELLAIAGAVEQRSEHPVGRAVALAARDRLALDRIPAATDHRALTGRGITASLDGRTVTVSSRRHFDREIGPSDESGFRQRFSRRADIDARQGRTPVMVEMDGRFLGTISLSDVPRPTARAAVEELQAMGIESVLLSGDSGDAARFLADQLGIREFRGDLLPGDKVEVMKEYRLRSGGALAMVGDGINDAPALASADVGIAVGGDLGGTDQAREAAAVTLMRDDLRALPAVIRLARATMRTVRANVAFAIGIKVAFLLLVLFGMGTLWMAVLADVGATLIVTLYGMRLLRWSGRPITAS